MYFLSIIPLSYTLDSFPLSYVCREEYGVQIGIGSLVEIPVGKKIELGVVMTINPYEGAEIEGIKSISAVICSAPLLAQYQMEAIVNFAKYTYQPIHKVALLFLPKSIVSFLARKSFAEIASLTQKDRKKSERNVIFHRGGVIDADAISKYIRDRKTVIIFPDIFLLSQFLETTEKTEEILSVLPTISPARRSRLWIDIRKMEKNIVAGTRRLLFFDLSAYDQILYIEDAFTDSYFQYPLRFRYLDVLASFGMSSPDITILSSTPSIYAMTKLTDFTRK